MIRDLFEILPDKLGDHIDYCSSSGYLNWESNIARPELERLGYSVIGWRTGDGDSFGPLTRVVTIEKNGIREQFIYG